MVVPKLEDYIPRLQAYFKDKPVLRAYVFGSFARGEQTEESDLDILVDLDYPVGMRFFDMTAELTEMFDRKVDLVSNGARLAHIRPYIENEKSLIYERALG